jgi:hypothetical protein
VAEIASGQVWKMADGEWVVVSEVHGADIEGRRRTIPGDEQEWRGSPADFDGAQLAKKRSCGATCGRWDDVEGPRVLWEHGIVYDSESGGIEVTTRPTPTAVGVGVILHAVSDEEAAERLLAALHAARAEPLGDVDVR